MANVPRKPPGNDPRLALGSAELEAASEAAYPQVAGKASKLDFGMLAIVAAALGIGAVTWITLNAQTSQPAQPAARHGSCRSRTRGTSRKCSETVPARTPPVYG